MRLFTLPTDAATHLAGFLALVGWKRPPVPMEGCEEMGHDLDPSLSTMLRDLALPPKGHLKPDQTIFLGPEEAWAGRLVIELDIPSDAACLFYQERMPALGWRMIGATVQASIRILAFVRGGRAASIQFEPGRLFGCTATLILLPNRDSASRLGILG